jgi:hypothetical protein
MIGRQKCAKSLAMQMAALKCRAAFNKRNMAVANAFMGRQAIQYGERERPEHRSIGLLIKAQVADAPRTVPETT